MRDIVRHPQQGWENRPLRGKGLVVIAIPLVALLAAAIAFFLATREGTQAAAQVQQSLLVFVSIERATALLVDAETGLRGYLLTGQPAFLEPFYQAEAALPATLARLETLVQDNPTQLARARRLREMTVQALEELRALRHLAAGQEPLDAPLLSGKATMDALRAELDAMEVEERSLLAERTARAEWARQLGLVVGAVSLAVGLLGGVLATVLLTDGVARRIDRLADNAGRLARRLPLLAMPTGRDEIGHLGRALMEAEDLLAGWERELREAWAFLEHLIAASPGLILRITLPDRRTTYVSPNITHLLGYTQDEALGDVAFWEARTHPADLAAASATFARVVSGELQQVEVEQRLRRRNGDYRWFYTLARVEGDGSVAPTSILGYCFDITPRKEAEAALRQARDELEQRVEERTADLTAANEQLAQRQHELEDLTRALLQQATKLERQAAELAVVNRSLAQKNDENEMFVYSASHDLRSPLVNLQGFSQELASVSQELRALLLENQLPAPVQQRALTLLDEDMASSLGFIQAAVLRLSGIIDALLRLSRAGRVDYQRQEVDLNALLARIVAALHGTITERDARVSVADLPPAWGDSTALEQVFANLLTNALAYLDPQRPGCIEVGGRPAIDGRHCTYVVADNGLGIPEHARAKLFQPFQRFHPTVAEGEGLGLALVRRIVERHGGHIGAESTPGEGSIFYVELPTPPMAPTA